MHSPQKSRIPHHKSPISPQKNIEYICIVMNLCDETKEHYSSTKEPDLSAKGLYTHIYMQKDSAYV